MSKSRPYLDHLQSAKDLVTPHEVTRAGFVALALEKNRRATRIVAEARALQQAASQASTPAELLLVSGIEAGLLTASGLSDKSLTHLTSDDKNKAISELIKNFLEPAGAKFVEELVFRFLITRGDTLGGSMRNYGGVLAQRKLTRSVISTLRIAGTSYRWLHGQTKTWVGMTDDDADIEHSLRGLSWQANRKSRTLIYNLVVPLVKKNVDLCLFDVAPEDFGRPTYRIPESYIALGELKGGVDPAGADEHWKTARTALDRIREAFSQANQVPFIFFLGAAIEKDMAAEIWSHLKNGSLSNAANLTDDGQLASISRWLVRI